MPARSKSQQRLFGMVHAYLNGKLKNAPDSVKDIAKGISDEDAKHFAMTKRKGLPEKKAENADYIESKARLHYPEEGSHGWNHIQDVLANARRMRRRELLKKELAAIMYHDSSLMTGSRETHADDSAAIARKELAGLFKRRQLEDIVNAIAHHRASYEGARSSRLEDLVASADRPIPDIAKQVARSWKYHEELGEPEGLRAENVASHLKEKYGHGGYAYNNAPKLYIKAYGKALQDVMSKFDSMTPESVASMMSGTSEKDAGARPSKEELWRMYDIIQADARLGGKLKGLGFGGGGDSYRRAAVKMHVMELARLLRDGKSIRNRIVHSPGYVPSEHEANRAIRQYEDADAAISAAEKR